MYGTEDRGSVADDGDLKENTKHACAILLKGPPPSKQELFRALVAFKFGDVSLHHFGCFVIC